jgi:predicted RecB family nuclease
VHLRDGRLVVSASDLVGHQACRHLTSLALEVTAGEREPPPPADGESAAVAKRGYEHEKHHLTALRRDHRSVVEIADDVPPDLQQVTTARALARGVDVVYQGTFFDTEVPGPAWLGHVDFLRRVDRSSAEATWRYEPEDTKLSRSVWPSSILQLCVYAEQLARFQGDAPERVHVVLGDGTRLSFHLGDFSAYYRKVKARFLDSLERRPITSPEPCRQCPRCPWFPKCSAEWESSRRLTLVAGLSAEQSRRLDAAGISTIDELASVPGSVSVRGMRAPALRRLCRQARLQVAAERDARIAPPYELLEPAEPARGLATLPEPSPGDLFFDIESDPLVGEDGLEYLFGIGSVGAAGFEHSVLWAHDRATEKRSLEDFVDVVVKRRRRHPDMHVYHYASYEPSALKRLMGRYGTREDAIDSMLRDDVLVDLYRVVRQGVAVGVSSYSLKCLEPLYMEMRTDEISDGASSIAAYEEWLATGDRAVLDEIRSYNRTDCESTWRLRDWLEARRAELSLLLGREIRRPGPGAPGPAVLAEAEREREEATDPALALAASLSDGVDGLPDETTPAEVRARWLLAQLVQWHRREDKPAWWRYFELVEHASDEDLFEDAEAVSGLVYEEVVGEVGRSSVHRYRFDPSQECKLPVGREALDPSVERAALAGDRRPGPGTLLAFDPVVGLLDLKRARASKAAHPTALIPPGPVSTAPLRKALVRLGEHALDHPLDGPGPWRAGRDLLAGRAPRVVGGGECSPLPGEQAVDSVVRLAAALDQSYLPVQGPPGSGKTRAAARLVVSLVAAGRRVGITAHTHAAIGNLLSAVVERAGAEGTTLRAMQKVSNGDGSASARVKAVSSNEEVEAALDDEAVDVVAGTPWLFSRPALHERFDHLVIDEGGQLSLANALAVSGAAANLVVFGDPRQLAQPSAGSHPPGAGASALEHVLGEAGTISAGRGVFLDRTYRLHPSICELVSEVVYEGRLRSALPCVRQEIAEGPLVGGSGLRFVPVRHTGNRTSSSEEAAVVAELYDALLGRPWTDREGSVAPLGPDDILVVAPYNAQVSLLAEHLPPGARVGTVDRFQGQEAPVGIVSMAASSAGDVPRGLEFLLSLNRLNVAVSRARAMSVMVASPELLAPECRSVEQMRLANAMCRFVELAEEVWSSGQVPLVDVAAARLRGSA